MNNTQVKEVTKESSLYLDIKQMAKLFILKMKIVFTSPILLFAIFIFPVIIAFGVGTLVPTHSLFTASFCLVQILLIGIVYGNLKYSVDLTTFKSNTRLTVINEIQLLVAIVSVVFIASFLSYNIQLAFIALCESNNFLFMNGFVFQHEDNLNNQDVIWKDIAWDGVYYYYLVTFLVNISLYFFANKFFKTYKGFCVFVLIWWLLTLMFGGVLSCVWMWYDPKTEEMVGSNKLLGAWSKKPYEEAVDYSRPTFVPTNWQSYVSFVLPQWFNNQHFFYVFGAGAQYTEPELIADIIPVNGITMQFPAHMNLFYWSSHDELWNFSLVSPYVYTTLYLMLGLILQTKK